MGDDHLIQSIRVSSKGGPEGTTVPALWFLVSDYHTPTLMAEAITTALDTDLLYVEEIPFPIAADMYSTLQSTVLVKQTVMNLS